MISVQERPNPYRLNLHGHYRQTVLSNWKPLLSGCYSHAREPHFFPSQFSVLTGIETVGRSNFPQLYGRAERNFKYDDIADNRRAKNLKKLTLSLPFSSLISWVLSLSCCLAPSASDLKIPSSFSRSQVPSKSFPRFLICVLNTAPILS